jgi:hypothetical protein
MGKIIRGTRDAKGVTTLKHAPGGYDKIRCPTCHSLAVSALDSQGKPCLKCTGPCGSTFRTSSL